MSADTFIERDLGDEASYLAEEQNGVSRESLIYEMEALLPFTKQAAYQWEDDCEALISFN